MGRALRAIVALLGLLLLAGSAAFGFSSRRRPQAGEQSKSTKLQPKTRAQAKAALSKAKKKIADPPHKWWLSAITASVTGLMWGLLVTITFDALESSRRFIPVVTPILSALDDEAFAAYTRTTPPPVELKKPYVLIDLDEAGCKAFVRLRYGSTTPKAKAKLDACARSPINDEFATWAAREALDHGAAAVILDVSAPLRPSAVGQASQDFDAVFNKDAPLVLVGALEVVTSAVGRQMSGCVIQANDRQGVMAPPDGALLASDLLDEGSAAGVIRFPNEVGYQSSTTSSRNFRALPSAPVAAYLLAERHVTPEHLRQQLGADGKCDDQVGALGALPTDSRVRLALCPVEDLGPESARPANCDIRPGITRLLVAPHLTRDGHLDIDPAGLKGGIVVVGSTAGDAEDLHQTPLGPMSGGEVILNRVLDLTAHLPGSASPFKDNVTSRLSREVAPLLIAGATMTTTWFALFMVLHGIGPPGRLAFLRLLVAVAIFCVGAATSVLLVVEYEASRPFEAGYANALFPAASVAFEGAIEGVAYAFGAAHAVTLAAVQAVVRRFSP
jgi:hypothetical protein